MQAQEPGPPFLGLWSRLEDFDADDLHRAIDAREVVRARMMRGTLHLVPAADFLRFYSAIAPVFSEWMIRYLGPRIEGWTRRPHRGGHGRVRREESLSAAELRDALAERRPDADVRALAAVVRTGLPLVRVPDGGRWAYTPRAPFTDAERWLERPLRKSRDVAGLVRRYLGAFGPRAWPTPRAGSAAATWPPCSSGCDRSSKRSVTSATASCSTFSRRRVRRATRARPCACCPSSTT